MEAICMKIVEMSIAASWLILAVIFLRLFLAKAPKGFRYVLWALVAIRLIFPFSIESNLSLVPDTDGFLMEETPEAEVPNESVGETVGTGENNMVTTPGQGITVPGTTQSVPDTTPSVQGSTPSTPGTTPSAPSTTPSVPDTNSGTSDEAPVAPQADELQFADVLPWIWAVGVVLLIVYMIISYVRLWNRVKISVPIDEKVYICDEIQSPFIFGVVRPNVYIPSHIENDQLTYILAHEREHLRCMDHMWKPLGFVLLAIHWFNPLVWVAYVLMCRDLELACDERVIRHMNSSEKRNYSETLLACSAPGHYISACPVAFGEIGIKERIKRVLSYKKPTVWVMAIAVLLCVVVSVCFMTDPAKAQGPNESETESELESESASDSEIESDTDSETDTNSENESETGTEPDTEPDTEEPVDIPVSTEKVLYETTADLNHDGIDDLVQTVVYSEDYTFDLNKTANVAYIQVFAGISEGNYEGKPCYRSAANSYAHSGNGAYCLVEQDGKDYLMYSNMDEREGYAYYHYNIFYLGEGINAKEIEVDKNDANFSTSPFYPEWLDTPHREDEVPEFQQKVEAWLEKGIVLYVLDIDAPIYLSTMEGKVSPKAYYGSVWARTDEAEIQRFYDIVGTEYWKIFFYNLDMSEMVDYYNALAASSLSKWYQAYNGETVHRIPGEGGLTTNHDVIYYAAGEGTDVQEVLKKMIETMILPRMEASDDRNYTITKYRIEDQPIIQIADNIWLIEYLNGYYAYEGFEGVASMEERLEYEEATSDGMLEFDRNGDVMEHFYLLIEENGVYRLEYGYYLDEVVVDASASTSTGY